MSELCIICGNPSCFESVDHSKTTFETAYSLLKQNKIINPQISEIISLVHTHYKTLVSRVKNQCKQDEKKIQRILSKYEYSHVLNNRISVDVIGNISGKICQAFPDRRIIAILENLEVISASRSYKVKQRFEKSQFYGIIMDYLEKSSVEQYVSKVKENLLGPLLQVQQRKQSPQKINIRKDSKEEAHDKVSVQFLIGNVSFDSKTKQILLSNKRITDKQMVDNIDSLKKLKVTGIQLRNNNITQLSCKILAFNMSHLTKIDIRGNKVKDVGIIVLAKHNTCLKQFFISQTDISDISAQVISQKLHLLQLIWAQNNRLTYFGAQMLVHHDKLKVINLEGNIINNQEAELLKSIFNKGYISV